MSNPFVAEIRIFPFNFAPTGWVKCQGQIMPISQNTMLFSLLGAAYGGNGTSNFALPDLQGAMPMQQGQGPGLSLHDLGETGGTGTVSLLTSEIPSHSHPINTAKATDSTVTIGNPSANVALGAAPTRAFSSQIAPVSNQVFMAPTQMGTAGSGQPHNNMPPYLTLNFCIAMQGVFPQRS